jgi:hypothetical protein
MCALLLFIAHRHAFQKANQPFTLESRPTSCNSSRRASLFLFSEYKNAPETLNFIVPILCRVMLQQMCEVSKAVALGPI